MKAIYEFIKKEWSEYKVRYEENDTDFEVCREITVYGKNCHICLDSCGRMYVSHNGIPAFNIKYTDDDQRTDSIIEMFDNYILNNEKFLTA